MLRFEPTGTYSRRVRDSYTGLGARWQAGNCSFWILALTVDLPQSAEPAWHAYLAMGESKAKYFTLLSRIDQRARDGGEPTTLAESVLLEKLLGEHSASVHRFSAAMAAVTDPAAREALIREISVFINPRFGGPG